MEYTAKQLAEEYGITPEAVRKYTREIRQLPEDQKKGLIREAGQNVYITESGKEWIEARRSGQLQKESPQEEKEDLHSRIELLHRVTAEDAEKIRDLEATVESQQKRIEYYSEKCEQLEALLEQEKQFSELYLSSNKTLEEIVELQKQEIEFYTDRIRHLEAHETGLLQSLQVQQGIALQLQNQLADMSEKKKPRIFWLFHRKKKERD